MVDVIALPPLPGLPDLHFADPATLPAGVATALTADAPAVLAALGAPAWGIYSGGEPVVIADTVAEVAYSKASGISNYPIEDGGFSAYDKQATPFEGRVRLASGGSPDVRQALLESVEAIEDDLGLRQARRATAARPAPWARHQGAAPRHAEPVAADDAEGAGGQGCSDAR